MEQLVIAAAADTAAPSGGRGPPPTSFPVGEGSALPAPAPVAAIASVSAAVTEAVVGLLPALADLAEMRSFSKAATLRQTLWHCLPGIARGLGESQREGAKGDRG